LSISVVIPCYRSARTLPALVTRLDAVMPGLTSAYEVILVVDDSTVETWSTACELARDHASVRAIRMARNYGQHSAVMAGVRAATHDVIITMDDDLQHLPEEVPKLVAALTEDLDLVYGVAATEEHSAVRSLASRTVKSGISRLLGVKNARDLSAFRIFRSFMRSGFDSITGPDISVDVALSWVTTRVTSIEVHMADRTEGRSGYSVRSLTRHAINMILGYSTAPLRFVTYLGLCVGVGGFAVFIRLIWLYFEGNTTVAGFTTIASLVAIFASAQMIAIGVLGEYVGRIHTNGMGRPTYIVRQQFDGAQATSGDAFGADYPTPSQLRTPSITRATSASVKST
jgi:glycosyltransferase involved in cell wall biosynthesis